MQVQELVARVRRCSATGDMAVAVAGGVALAGASRGRMQAPAAALKAPIASLAVASSRSRAVQVEACQSLAIAARLECGCDGLRGLGRRRGGHGFIMSRSAMGRVFASSAVEDKVSQAGLPHSDEESSDGIPQVRNCNRNVELVSEFGVVSIWRV